MTKEKVMESYKSTITEINSDSIASVNEILTALDQMELASITTMEGWEHLTEKVIFHKDHQSDVLEFLQMFNINLTFNGITNEELKNLCISHKDLLASDLFTEDYVSELGELNHTITGILMLMKMYTRTFNVYNKQKIQNREGK